MQNYKMTIAYDGRKYIGFNKSKGKPGKSIQDKLEDILVKYYGKPVEVIGAVNTGAGVHAKHQVVNFTVPNNDMNRREILEYFEKYLTDDIIVLSIEAVDERFHSRYLAQAITYEYRLWRKDALNRPLFERQYVNLMTQKVDIDRIKIAAEHFEGEHDFAAFTNKKKAKNTIKKLSYVNVSETKNEIVITITANSFLLNMERIIVGTLIQIGLGQLPVDIAEGAFETKDTDDAGHKASAGALCLVDVEY